MPTSQNGHDARISALRGVLIFLVTLGHVIQWTAYPSVPGMAFRDPVFIGIYLFHVPLFFAVSGHLLGARGGTLGWNKGLRRLATLAVPSVAWFILTTIALRARTWVATGRFDASLPGWNAFSYGLAMHGWYVWCLCAFILVLIATPGSTVAKALALGLATASLPLLPEGNILFLLQYAFPFLTLGYLHGAGMLRENGGFPWALRTALLLASALVFLAWKPEDFVYFRGWSLHSGSYAEIGLRFTKQLVVTVTAADLLWLFCSRFPVQALSFLGDRTLFVYLSENLLILAGAPLWKGLPLDSRAVVWLFCPALALLVSIACLGLERLASRHWMSAFLLGSRQMRGGS